MQPSNKVTSVRRFVWKVKEPVKLATPAKVVKWVRKHIFSDFNDLQQEELWGLLLDNRHNITHQVMSYRGNVGCIPVRITELFREAVRVNASYLILTHNHPSGEVGPSGEDIGLTKQIVEAGRLLGCKVSDHVILSVNGHYSLKENGNVL